MNEPPPGSPAWPPVDLSRMADVVSALAERVAEGEVRVQLHALSAVLRNLGREGAGADARWNLQQRLAAAVDAEDERAALEALRGLTRMNRELVVPVDWTAASGG